MVITLLPSDMASLGISHGGTITPITEAKVAVLASLGKSYFPLPYCWSRFVTPPSFMSSSSISEALRTAVGHSR